jgi:hypothetical protein
MADIGKNKVSEQEIYNYLMSKPGMTDVKAQGILANIKAESNLNPSIRGDYMIADPTGELKNKERLVFQKSDGKYYYMKFHPTKAGQEVDASLIEGIESTSGGLFQHQGSRYNAMVAEVGDNWETNWKGQIDFALQEQEAQNYMNTDFTSVSDSTKAFMVDFEKPADQSDEAVNKRVEGLNDLNITTTENNTAVPQPPVLDAEGNIVAQPTKEEGNAVKELSEKKQKEEEEKQKQIIINKRGEDAKEYQKLIARNKRLRSGYKPADMPAVFAREIRNNEKRMSEIAKEYNFEKPSDEEFDNRKEEILSNIIIEDKDTPTLDEQTLLKEALENVEAIGEEEENVDDLILKETVQTDDDKEEKQVEKKEEENLVEETVEKPKLKIEEGILDDIGGFATIASALVGANALKEANMPETISELPELSDAFQAHLYQQEQLSKQGFSPDQEAEARKSISDAYQLGIENAVRGTAGDRAKFLAMSGVLDSRRQAALLDFAAKDEVAMRANKEQYEKTLMFKEQFDIQKQQQIRNEELEAINTQYSTQQGLAAQAFKYAMDNISNAKADKMQNRLIQTLTADAGSGYDVEMEKKSLFGKLGQNISSLLKLNKDDK